MILFLYDKLMTKEEQAKLKINFKFISFAQLNCKMYYFYNGKIKVPFAYIDSKNTTNQIYGGLFYINNEEFYNKNFSLFSYYYNSSVFTGKNDVNNLFIMEKVTVSQIKFKSLTELQNQRHKISEPLEC